MSRLQHRFYVRTFEEIGEELGLPRKTVEFIYNRAIAKLKARKAGGLFPSMEQFLEEPRFQPPSPVVSVRERAQLQHYDHLRTHDYRDWSPESTRVVSGPIGEAKFPGRRFNTRDEARAYWQERVDIVEEYPIKGRYIFRVLKNGTTRTVSTDTE